MSEGVVDMMALADEIEGFIQEVVPKAETVQKYGGTLFTLRPDEKEGQFCGVFVHKKHVQLSFSNGASLKDPAKLLLGSGKFRRHVNVSSPDELNRKELKKLLRQASSL